MTNLSRTALVLSALLLAQCVYVEPLFEAMFPPSCYPKSHRHGAVAPAIPVGLTGMTADAGAVDLHWTDQAGCTFNIYVDGSLYQTGVSWDYTVRIYYGDPGEEHEYAVSAVDTVTGLESAPCEALGITSGS